MGNWRKTNKMNLRKLITRSFFHYLRANIMAAGGLAVATAVITGAFIIGDSLRHSLERAVIMRLGNITHSVTAGERLFTMETGKRFEEEGGMPVSVGLVAEGMAVAVGGTERINNIQVLGIDGNFGSLLGKDSVYSGIEQGEVIISENMARRLQLEKGDFFMLRMKRAGVIPMNTPLVSDADQSVARRVKVAAIAGNEDYGRFNLRVSQTAPFNVFAGIEWLNMVMGLEGMGNIIFISDPGAQEQELSSYLKNSWDIEDANLTLKNLPGTSRLEIGSERVFIDEHISSQLGTIFPGSMQFITYFVNSLEKGDRSTPYSFVTAGNRYSLERGEVVISRWLADDLSAGTGDTLVMRYWETGTRRELTEKETKLVVRGIEEMRDVISDSILMPHLPGLSDAGNCRDWDAGVPVVLDRIRDKDEKYWDDYKGTPKAYIALELGEQLWTNRFGNLTSVWLPEEMVDETVVREKIRSSINPLQLGFQVNDLRNRGLQSAAGGVDFGMLFGGLGFFVMLAGVILFFLLVLFNMEKRQEQIRLFSSLGYPLKTIRKIYLGEGMLIALTGSSAGLLLAVLYGRAVYWGLSQVWQDIVRTDMLEMAVKPASLLIGFAIGITIAFLVILFSLNRYILKKPLHSGTRAMQQEKIPVKEKNKINENSKGYTLANKVVRRKIRNRLVAVIVFALCGIFVLIRQLLSGADTDPVSFFVAGGLLIPSFLLLADVFLLRMEEKHYQKITMNTLSMKNLARNRTRSLSVIILLALGIFVVIATGSHRKDAAAGETHMAGGTGGFLFVAEATVPVLHDINSREVKLLLNIPPYVNFVQFMASYADDASCLNLNEVSNPRILAANTSQLSGRFSFAKGSEWLSSDDPWESLNRDFGLSDNNRIAGDNTPVIPAIADQAVIQWGLGKKVGDTLTYTDERGDELKLLLIGGLANSVFQGNVIISEKHFLRHFPTVSGSSFFLVDAGNALEEEAREELEFIFRDHGWEMTTTVNRLNEFNSVENTYLGIFLMLGALGILLGVVGLSVVMARSIIERKSEIALYTSLGYKRSQINAVIFREYLALLIAGLAAGVPPALIAGLPSLLPGSQSVNPTFLVLLTTAILLNGILWIVITSRLMIGNISITSALRND